MQNEIVNNNNNAVLEPWERELKEWTPIAETYNEFTDRLTNIIVDEFINRPSFIRRYILLTYYST
jgi:hypothetical protein